MTIWHDPAARQRSEPWTIDDQIAFIRRRLAWHSERVAEAWDDYRARRDVQAMWDESLVNALLVKEAGSTEARG